MILTATGISIKVNYWQPRPY